MVRRSRLYQLALVDTDIFGRFEYCCLLFYLFWRNHRVHCQTRLQSLPCSHILSCYTPVATGVVWLNCWPMFVCIKFAWIRRDVSALSLLFDLLCLRGYFRCFGGILLWLYFGLRLIWELFIRILCNIFYIFGCIFIGSHILQHRLLKLLAIVVILAYFSICRRDCCSRSDFLVRIFFLQLWFFYHLPFWCWSVTCDNWSLVVIGQVFGWVGT